MQQEQIAKNWRELIRPRALESDEEASETYWKFSCEPLERGFGVTDLRVPELKEKILFTLMCLAIYRFCAHITVPGVDVVALRDLGAALQGVLIAP